MVAEAHLTRWQEMALLRRKSGASSDHVYSNHEIPRSIQLGGGHMPCELRSESALFGRFLSGHFCPVLYSLGSGWAVFGRFCQHADRSCFAKKKVLMADRTLILAVSVRISTSRLQIHRFSWFCSSSALSQSLWSPSSPPPPMGHSTHLTSLVFREEHSTWNSTRGWIVIASKEKGIENASTSPDRDSTM